MRRLTYKERNQYGCTSCIHKVNSSDNRSKCPYEACPYQEIAEYSSYEEFLEETWGGTPIEYFLHRGGHGEVGKPCKSS